jgi:hypothetical protein
MLLNGIDKVGNYCTPNEELPDKFNIISNMRIIVSIMSLGSRR